MAPSYSEIVGTARRAYAEGRTRPVEFRRKQLQQYKKMLEDHRDEFLKALAEDLNKPKLEAVIFEVDFAMKDADYLLANLDKWVKTEEVPSVVPGDKSLILREPYGVCLVMGAWNYPLQLALIPAAGAIAAGNAVVIKPSEVSPATAAAIAKYLPQYLDKECFPVVLGGVPETTELLKERFDYIFYTGSTGVGKIVQSAASKHLTPTTLELGGKSPCYVDNSADLDIAVRRILWGKMFNLGQTCIAPDYILCPSAVQSAFVDKCKAVLKEWYGNEAKKSSDLSRIVAERHVDRLANYLKDGTPVIGGKYDKTAKWVEPTVLVDVKADSRIMQEEIFGPILPILNVAGADDAITFINKREKPLALYVFSKNKGDINKFLEGVSCGGLTVNDTLHHAANHNLPFGGVGYSGMGAYHGDYTFKTFTHYKPVLIREYEAAQEKMLSARYPPYSDEKLKVLTA
ncbi:aldehyde dehydrogenase, dimeric NADP-preferring-like [Eriocheir sinensis]|uniref:aldehyde dehydrogenase, dimeric NADP-preferring-like n=1 Tax=Eriocheir sinensis TaxID=95602 RepID=UPI0021C9967C|nr:aldehyde dehydrogenase, dimeric NADP-preferring-like [Eriocheir sinensis]